MAEKREIVTTGVGVSKGGLVPSMETAEMIVEMMVDMMSRHGKTLREMLDCDSAALTKDDMRYFNKSMFGKVPTYGMFCWHLRRVNKNLMMELEETEASVLGGMYENGLRDIYERPTDEMDGSEGKRFSWGEKLYKIQERKINRLIKARGEDGVEKGVDLAIKVIAALSDKQLMGVKNIMEAEWEEVDNG